MMIRSAIRALHSLPSGSLFFVFVFSICINIIALGLLVAAVYFALSSFSWFGMWDWLADWGLTTLAAGIAYFMFPIFLPLVITFFDTRIAAIIERDEYPQVPTPEPPFWPTFGQDVMFTLKALGLNILVLPLYLVPGINIILYYLLNGYLLGNEFFNVIAGRHIDACEAPSLRRAHRLSLIGCGSLIAFCSTIPFVNLVAPIFGVVLMVHFFHALKPKYKIVLGAN